MNTITRFLFSTMTFGTLSFSAGALAAGSKTFVLNGGWGYITTDSTVVPEATWNAGAAVDIGLNSSLSFGLYVDYQASTPYDLVIASVALENQMTYIPYGITLNIHTGPLYFGANAGSVSIKQKVTTSGSSITDSGSSNSIGGQIGIDFKISAKTSLGIEGRYLYLMTDPTLSLMQGKAQLKFVL